MNIRSRKDTILVSIAVLILSAGWILISAPEPGQLEISQEAPSVGFQAPNFTLESMDGESVSLSELRGQAVIINLWASWCGPCRAEMPAMQNIYEKYKDQDFTILAVNASNQDSLAAARAFSEELGLSYPILLDVDGSVSQLYNLRALPTTYFVSGEGRIEEVVIGGPMAEALLEIRAEQLIGGLK